MNKIVAMQAPWATLHSYIKSIFDGDSDVSVKALAKNDEIYVIPVQIKNHDKYLALHDIMIQNYHFGNVSVQVQLLYDTGDSLTSFISNSDKIKAAFKNNSSVGKIVDKEMPTGDKEVFVCFKPEVVQFYNDDLSDYSGNYNGLMEDIAREVFNVDWRTNFCTVDKNEPII